jgi:hypothetical protein
MAEQRQRDQRRREQQNEKRLHAALSPGRGGYSIIQTRPIE